MNTVNIKGGLGNQLFQIYALMAYCIEYNKQYTFLYNDKLTIGTTRPTYWNNLLINLKKFTTTDKNIYKLPYYNEISFSYNKIPHNKNAIVLNGYFQSYKYFVNYFAQINDIIGIYNIQQQIKNNNTNILTTNNNQILISLHFRLGDYKNIQDYHPIMKLSYYIDSLKYIINQYSNKVYKVLYFCEKSDNILVQYNIDKIKQTLNNTNIKFVKVNDTIEDWQQMLIMSLCDNNIIANSSFSWWGAYYNNNKNKIVCYPSIWFGDAMPEKDNVQDLCPNDWIKI